MALLDSTIVAVSLPKILEYFSSNLKTISWVINAYNIAFAVALITGSRIADQFGRKLIFVFGVSLFTLTSFLCGMSHSVQWLIFFRILQGISAAFVVPVSMPLILKLFPPNRSGVVVGVWGAISAIAAASGPALGGIITEYFKWQWIFYLNIPIGIVTLIFLILLVEESFDRTASKKIDWTGIITLSVGIFCLTYALVQANDEGWTSVYIRNLFTASFISLVLFAITEIKQKEPMLPLYLFKSFPFVNGTLNLLITGIALMCGAFFLSLFLTIIMGMSQVKAGLVITAIPITSMVFSAIVGPLSDRVDTRWFSISGTAILCIAVYLFSQITEHSPLTAIIWRLCVAGAGLGLSLPAVVVAAIKAVPGEKVGIGSGVANMARILGMVLGVSLLVSILTHYANPLFEEAKVSAGTLVNSSQVLRKDVKETFTEHLKTVKFSHNSKLPTEQEIVVRFEEKRDAALKAAKSDLSRNMQKVVYRQQINEIKKLFPQIRAIFKEQLAAAFSKTFKAMCFITALAIVFAVFSDRRKNAAQSDVTGRVGKNCAVEGK